MSTHQKIPKGLLSDAPADKDQLDQQPHDKIADAIFNLIFQSIESGTIALVGRMGSGKSSIVRMLENKRSQKSKSAVMADGHTVGQDDRIVDKQLERIQIFVFDAWAHQGDSLRRTFLQQLGNFLLDPKMPNSVDSKRYREWQEELRSKLAIHQIAHESANPTLWGIALAIAAFFTSLGLLFLSRDAKLGSVIIDFLHNVPFVPVIDTSDRVGTFFIILAISVMLAMLVYFAVVKFLNRHIGFRERLSFLPNPNFAREVISSTSMQTLDPSSFEFAELFKSLMHKMNSRYLAQPDKPNWKLLIVVDNLDRVPNEVVWNLWSTLQVFLEMRNARDAEAWKDKVWILAAFDQEALIQNILRMESSLEIAKDSGNGDEEGITSDVSSTDIKTRGERIRTLIAKTFQITFYVPPPHLKAWEEYFISQYAMAFGPLDDSFQRVLSVYRICRSKRKLELPPTPREMKLFLNNLLALSLRPTKSEIPREVMALYAFFEEEISIAKNPYEAITAQEMLTANILQSFGNIKRESCLQYLAALYYGIEPENAGVELVKASMRDTLFANAKGNTQGLDDLIQTCRSGLRTLIYAIIEQEDSLYSKDAGPSIVKLSHNLAYLQEKNPESQNQETKTWADIWEKVCSIAIIVTDWSKCNNTMRNGLVNNLQYNNCRSVQQIQRKMADQPYKRVKSSTRDVPEQQINTNQEPVRTDV